MYETTLNIRSNHKRQMIDITEVVSKHVRLSEIEIGEVFLYNPHTTAGLTINEGADPDVQRDILNGLNAMVPRDIVYHHQEGNSRAHIMASLIGPSVHLAVANSILILGTWQRIFFCEFDGPRDRQIHCRITNK